MRRRFERRAIGLVRESEEQEGGQQEGEGAAEGKFIFLILLLIVVKTTNMLGVAGTMPKLFHRSKGILLSSSNRGVRFPRLGMSRRSITSNFCCRRLARRRGRICHRVLRKIHSVRRAVLLRTNRGSRTKGVCRCLVCSQPRLF